MGVTALDGADAGPVDVALLAVTVKVYEISLTRPGTVIGLPAPMAVVPPGEAVTVKWEKGESPDSDGRSKLTVAWLSPAVATTPVGAVGAQNGVTALLGADTGPGSVPFAAVTTNVYVMPWTSPVTAIGLDVPVAVTPSGLEVTV